MIALHAASPHEKLIPSERGFGNHYKVTESEFI